MHDTRAKKGNRKEYRHEMTTDQHVVLLTEAQTVQGFVVISGYDTELYNDMLANWHRYEKKALADGARERKEVVWISPNTPLKNELF